MTRFVAIDLANLPAPTAVVPPDIATIITVRKATIVTALAAVDPALAEQIAATLAIEASPLSKVVEADAYRELLHYERVNEAVRAVLLATAAGADLDNLAARLDVVRLSGETDQDLRYRYQIAPEAFSTAGPYGAYEYVARSAHPDIADVAVYGPETGLVPPGNVLVVVLSRLGDGRAGNEILDAVRGSLSKDDTRPLTDFVSVISATIVAYGVNYRLQMRPGANPALIVNQAGTSLRAYADAGRKIGRVIAVSALDACAHQDRVNVIRAVKVQPDGEVNPGLTGAAFCPTIIVDYEVIDG